MNLLDTIYAIKALNDKAEWINKTADNKTMEDGTTNYPYAFGRLSYSAKDAANGIEILQRQLPNLDKIYEVLGVLGLDGDVIDRILALKRREQDALSEAMSEMLDEHEVLHAPKPEVVYCPDCDEAESDCECFKPTPECLSDCHDNGRHSVLCQHSC
jgi:hypothetical protein